MKDTQELRKKLQNVKKLAREQTKAITLRIPQLGLQESFRQEEGERARTPMVFIYEGSPPPLDHNCCDNEQSDRVRNKGQTLNVWDNADGLRYESLI